MSKIARNPTTGAMFVQDREDPTGWRPITQEEIPGLRPAKVLDEMGVPRAVRFTLKNFARNPAMGAMYLRSLGYQVVQYGSGLNYAVRKADGDPWRVVDPAMGGVTEFFNDIIDLGSDLFSAGAATVGTIFGGGIGGAIGAGGSELLRQAIGEAAGIEGNLAPLSLETGFQVAAGAAGPAIGKGLGLVGSGIRKVAGRVAATGRVTSDITEELVGRFTGIEVTAERGIFDTLVERGMARSGSGQLQALKTPADAVSIMREVLEKIGGRQGVLETLKQERNVLVENLAKTGQGKIDMSDFVRSIQAVKKRTEGFLEPDVLDFTPEGQMFKDVVTGILNPPRRAVFLGPGRVGKGLDFANKEEAKSAFNQALQNYETAVRNVDPRVVIAIEKQLQAAAKDAKAIGITVADAKGRGPALNQAFAGSLGKLQANLRLHIRDSLEKVGGKRFSDIQDELSRKLDLRNALRDVIGNDVASAENFVINAMSPGKELTERQLMKAFDAEFADQGFEFSSKLISEVSLGLQFTKGNLPSSLSNPKGFGIPRKFPRLTPQGNILGPSVFGALFGTAALGPLGGLIGLGVGASIASPAALVKMAPGARAVVQALSRGVGAAETFSFPPQLSRAGQLAGINTLMAIARSDAGRAVAKQGRESETRTKPRRRTSLLP